MLFGLFPYVLVPGSMLFNVMFEFTMMAFSPFTLWIDILYNAYFFVDLLIDTTLIPYYLGSFIYVSWFALRDRDMYDDAEDV